MSWTCHGSTNDEMVAKLQDYGILKSKAAADAMHQIDRADYVLQQSSAYIDSPQPIGYSATISAPHRIILGSSSTARQSILREMGFNFTVMTADIDEKAIRREKPEDLVMALAEAKADAIMSKLANLNDGELNSEIVLLITADQVVVHEGIIKEKPSNEEEARQFIKGYSRAPASTIGSVLVTNLKTGLKKGGWDKAEVYFHPIPDEIIESLIKEGLVFKVAGGLLVEHPLNSPFVEAVVGSIDSVMGLPKELTLSLIREVL